MLTTRDLTINIEDVEESLQEASRLFDSEWLRREHCQEPSDLILAHRLPDRSLREVDQAIREGRIREMHPLAEAILVGEEVLGHYRRNKNMPGSLSLLRLLSLRDVAKRVSNIKNAEARLKRLQDGQWKPALYELLTAVAYSEHGQVELIDEGASPSPDLKVFLESEIYVECKAKLLYEQSVVEFISRARREALGKMAGYLRQVDAGFVVKIDVLKNSVIPKLPALVQDMVTQGIKYKSYRQATIDITPFDSTTHVLSKPMQFYSAELWELMVGFTEWRDWHYVLPGGKFRVSNLSNIIVNAVQRPCLICIRSKNLCDSTQNIRQTLKDACRRQLKSYTPGVIHMLVNAQLYGIGNEGTIENVVNDLQREGNVVLRDYSRLSSIVFDIVSPPLPGRLTLQHRRLVLGNIRPDAIQVKLPQLHSVLLQ